MKGLTLERLRKCKDLPTPPVVATKIIDLSAEPNADIETLASIVRSDPSLTTRILAMANSSLYMRKVDASTVEQAVAMFGWNGTLNIAIGFAVMGSVRNELSNGLDYNHFWKRSLSAAIAARQIAQIIGAQAKEELFLPGLLQDIGMLALDSAYPKLYEGIGDKQLDHKALQQIEQKELETDHASVGGWLLAEWGIPEHLSYLVETSHAGDEGEMVNEYMDEQKCVVLSGYIADCVCCPEQVMKYEYVAWLAETLCDIDVKGVMQLIEDTITQFEELAVLFNVDLGDPEEIDQGVQSIKRALTA